MRAEQLELNAIDSRKRYVGLLPRQAGWAKWAYLGWAVPPIYRDDVSTRQQLVLEISIIAFRLYHIVQQMTFSGTGPAGPIQYRKKESV